MIYYKYNPGGYADLHIHTTASDGLLTPSQLVNYAKLKGIKCAAITDHDTTSGIDEAVFTGLKLGVEIIPGVELNAKYMDTEVHIIGYYIDYKSDSFQDILKRIRDSRQNRGIQFILNLKKIYNLDIDYSEVVEEAGCAAIGRPHIARVIIRKGYAKDMTDAFSRYLDTDNPAYVERYRLAPEEAIDIINKAGGVSSLAHPALIGNDNYIEPIISCGIQCIEAYHSKHTPGQVDLIKKLAIKHGLVLTGGSDCHGELYDGMPILGDVSVEKDTVDMIKKISATRKNA